MSEVIKTLEEEIQAKRLIVRALKAEQRMLDKKMFREGKVARGYMHTVRFLTKPFVKVNSKMSQNLESPVAMACHEIRVKLVKLIKQAEGITEVPNAKIANKCAKALLETEQFMQRYSYHLDLNVKQHQLESLRTQIERLRPAESKKNVEELRQKVEEAIQLTDKDIQIEEEVSVSSIAAGVNIPEVSYL